MKFDIKHYDTTLLSFNFIDKGIEGQFCEITYINEEKKDLLPLGFEVSEKGVMSWLKKRIIPKNREFVDSLLSKLGFSHHDTIGIIKICKGLSLNDSYWVVEDGFTGKFDNYNLYENKFDNTLALLAYTGYGSVKAQGFTSSPEFTTNGMLKKAWRLKNGKISLYKGGTSGGINTGKEPYSEFYASQLASAMEINHIDYSLSMWKGSLCSTCELFTSKQVSYVPIYDFVKDQPIKAIADFLKSLGDDYYNSFVDMLIFDALICNTDRHYGNFGLLVDSTTNKPIGFAPLFDHGISLFNDAMPDDFKNIEDLNKYAQTRISYYNVPFLELAKIFISKAQKDKLRKLINFKFKKHSTYNLPAIRLKQIENFIQSRLKELLEL